MDFMFEDHKIRTTNEGGVAMVVAADVGEALGLRWWHERVQALSPKLKGRGLIPTPRGEQEMALLTEAGLYCLIFRSKKPAALRFTEWVASEVLPQIRRTGSYNTKKPSDQPDHDAGQPRPSERAAPEYAMLQEALGGIERDLDMLKTFILKGPIRLPVILPGLGRYTVTADYYDTKIVDSRIRTAYLDDDLFKVMRMMAIIEDVTRVYHDTGLREVLLATKSKFPDELDGPIYSAQSLIAWFRDVYRDDIASLCRRRDIDEKARDRRKNWS